jgi:guanine deaminase
MNKFMQIAIAEAEKSLRQKDGGPFGAVVIQNGEIIAKNPNADEVRAHLESLMISD